MKYLQIALLVLSFLGGVWITHRYYDGQRVKLENQALKERIEFNNMVLRNDKKYREDLETYKTKIATNQKRVRDEVVKPEYQCPISESASSMLNDAINSANSKESKQ